MVDKNIVNGIMKTFQNNRLSKNEVITLLDIDDSIWSNSPLAFDKEINIYDLNNFIKKRNNIYNFSKASPDNQVSKKNVSSNGLNVLDLYSGAGGLSSGFKQCG